MFNVFSGVKMGWIIYKLQESSNRGEGKKSCGPENNNDGQHCKKSDLRVFITTILTVNSKASTTERRESRATLLQ